MGELVRIRKALRKLAEECFDSDEEARLDDLADAAEIIRTTIKEWK